jgi:hypothetical protein
VDFVGEGGERVVAREWMVRRRTSRWRVRRERAASSEREVRMLSKDL